MTKLLKCQCVKSGQRGTVDQNLLFGESSMPGGLLVMMINEVELPLETQMPVGIESYYAKFICY